MTKQKIVGRISALFLMMALAHAQGAVYYVSTQGSDANPGSSTQPFRTLTHAYSLAGPGVTILVAPGTYTDYSSGWGLHLGANGTAASPIILRSQVRGGAIIDGQNASDRNEAIYIDGSYNVVDGFVITGGPNGGISIWGNGNQILNSEVRNNGNPASSSSNGHDGIYDDESTAGNVYVGNYIHDNGRVGGSNLDHGLYLCGKNEQVINNVMVRNNASGLQIAGYATVSNLQVYNNVMAWNGTSGIILWQALSGIVLENNMVYQNGHAGMAFYAATGSGVVIDHNLVYGNGYGNYDFSGGGSTATYSLGTTISLDPQFMNESQAGFDAHLGGGSPAIQAGLNLSATFTTDLTGAARPVAGAWDLGAYAYTAVNPTPPTVTISSPVNGATISGTAVVFSASAADATGISGVQFKWDGANLGSVLTAAPYTLTVDTTTAVDGTHTLTAVATDSAGLQATSSPITVTVSNSIGSTPLGTSTTTIWVDDALPGGAIGAADGGDGWNWVASNPSPYSGTLASESNLGSGLHEHYFYGAKATLAVNTGDVMFAYIYLDPANPPSEVMLQWNNGSWEHRAYWGADLITYGADKTSGRYYLGALPAAGQWVRLAVPASEVGLEGSTLNGMAFTLYGGRATWDYAGKSANTADTTSSSVTTNVSNSTSITTVWVDDALPAGAVAAADGGDGWNWGASNPSPYSGTLASESNLGSGLHEHYFYRAAATLAVNTGDTLFAYVYLDPANPPSEVMLQWNNGSWEHRAYWGADLITYGADKTSGRYYMGALPAVGQWVRLAAPASVVGLEGSNLNGMSFTLYGGRAAWDYAGKSH